VTECQSVLNAFSTMHIAAACWGDSLSTPGLLSFHFFKLDLDLLAALLPLLPLLVHGVLKRLAVADKEQAAAAAAATAATAAGAATAAV
jgi:hypothetical protein